MNIVLIGYRCCGKTSIGKVIADRLNKKFVDTDELIIKNAGSSIDEIVTGHSWEYFREIERGVIKEASSMENLVIATGGGVVTNEENVKNLKSNGFIIWLYADINTIRKRLNKDKTSAGNRPSLTGDDPSDEISKVLDQRKSLYMKASDMAVDTSKLDIDEVADIVVKEIEQRN